MKLGAHAPTPPACTFSITVRADGQSFTVHVPTARFLRHENDHLFPPKEDTVSCIGRVQCAVPRAPLSLSLSPVRGRGSQRFLVQRTFAFVRRERLSSFRQQRQLGELFRVLAGTDKESIGFCSGSLRSSFPRPLAPGTSVAGIERSVKCMKCKVSNRRIGAF